MSTSSTRTGGITHDAARRTAGAHGTVVDVNGARDRRADAVTRALGWLSVLGVAAGLVMAFGVAPREEIQGNVQRIMYLHVPSVLVAYLSFAVVFAASVVYLARRSEATDRLAQASAETGVLFTAITIASGSIWGKPTWGTWWTWDARLTSVAILFVMYLGYLLLRAMIDDRERAARYSAVLGIVAALDVPLVHFSVYWWRTLHQPPSIIKPGPSTMPSVFVVTLLVNLVALALLSAYFVVKRARLLAREQEAGA
jgi:heme exporter protein C